MLLLLQVRTLVGSNSEALVKKTSRQAYRDIESAMGEVKFAFSKVPPNQSQVVAVLLKLQATDQKFIADSRGEPRAETNTSNVTIASLIERLNRADAAIDKHDFADSAAEIKGFQTDWLEVEGIVKTKSKSMLRTTWQKLMDF